MDKPAAETPSAVDPQSCSFAVLRETGSEPGTEIRIGLLTGGDDKSYALGLASALLAEGISLDFIGSDTVNAPMLHDNPMVNFLNLRGSQREDVGFGRKVVRMLAYYGRLISYAGGARPRIFHILWNNKFEWFDRTALMLYYRLFRKRVVFTAHNVNMRKRDGGDSWWNRLSLRIQYRLSDHIFVHADRMKGELLNDFGVSEHKVSVIPFGINNTCPTTKVTRSEARQRLGVCAADKTALFFGQIAPYKGLEYLIDAFSKVAKQDESYRLVIAGKVKKGHSVYWDKVRSQIAISGVRNRIIERIEHIPDEEVELYFRAADVLIVPYVQIFQSGVPFLAYSFGLPVIATDVGSLRQDIVAGKTGFICEPRNSSNLAGTIERYFESELFRNLEMRREEIKRFANERYSWAKVASISANVYADLLKN